MPSSSSKGINKARGLNVQGLRIMYIKPLYAKVQHPTMCMGSKTQAITCKKVIFPPPRTPWPHQGYQGHCQVQASVATTFSTPHQPITCKQVSKCHHMCVGAFIMPSNHIKCKQWASWPLQGHQGLHQGFQVFIKSTMTTSSPLRGQGQLIY